MSSGTSNVESENGIEKGPGEVDESQKKTSFMSSGTSGVESQDVIEEGTGTVEESQKTPSVISSGTIGGESQEVIEEGRPRCVRNLFDHDSSNGEKIITPPKNDNATLCDVLTWPETPKRKGKRSVERLPFVVTSGKWRQMIEEKKRIKLEKEQEKEKRKIERKIKQEQKQAMKKKRKRTSPLNKEPLPKQKKVLMNCLGESEKNIVSIHHPIIGSSSQSQTEEPENSKIRKNKSIFRMCYVCTKTVKQGSKCSKCDKAFHNSCIPVKHRENIPDDSDEDLFLCHICYTVQDESDEDFFNELCFDENISIQ